mmetsp:Transcript_21251/g.27412  ORF Transcript_21251/g.27412 Transcript_21251/m.27412 type:complete len:88 (-) Transcript_21251:1334-1597(-)
MVKPETLALDVKTADTPTDIVWSRSSKRYAYRKSFGDKVVADREARDLSRSDPAQAKGEECVADLDTYPKNPEKKVSPADFESPSNR